MLKSAYKLLETEYNRCLHNVCNNEYLSKFAQEKIRHSMQVAGAGNYLIRRIKWLQNQSPDYIELVKTAVLLHDICRFAEIEFLAQGKKGYDHGVIGAQFLKNTSLFSDIRIWLPIRHHGHLIECLYADPDYQNITDKSLQEEVKHICFIIRDADKIANLHMLVQEQNVLELFLGGEAVTPKDKTISSEIKEKMYDAKTLPRGANFTPADRMAGYLSWYFDINYRYAVDFCSKLNVTTRLFKMFDNICEDNAFKSDYQRLLTQYLKHHQFLD